MISRDYLGTMILKHSKDLNGLERRNWLTLIHCWDIAPTKHVEVWSELKVLKIKNLNALSVGLVYVSSVGSLGMGKRNLVKRQLRKSLNSMQRIIRTFHFVHCVELKLRRWMPGVTWWYVIFASINSAGFAEKRQHTITLATLGTIVTLFVFKVSWNLNAHLYAEK